LKPETSLKEVTIRIKILLRQLYSLTSAPRACATFRVTLCGCFVPIDNLIKIQPMKLIMLAQNWAANVPAICQKCHSEGGMGNTTEN